MGKKYKGRSDASNPDAGFRAATADAVEQYKADVGPPARPVDLRVVEMYVEVRNPIHGYIVVLEANP